MKGKKLFLFTFFAVYLFSAMSVPAATDLSAPIAISGFSNMMTAVSAWDMDGDNDIDLVLGDYFGNIVISTNPGNPFVSSWSNSTILSIGDIVSFLKVAKLDMNAQPDLIIRGMNGPIYAATNTGTWGLTTITSRTMSNYSEAVFLTDFNLDGYYDIAASFDDNISIFESDNTDPFNNPWTEHRLFSYGYHPVAVTCGDLDGDGYPDIIVSLETGSDTNLYIYKNPGTFGGVWTVNSFTAFTGTYAEELKLLDVDGDGDLDLAALSIAGNLAVFQNDGTPFTGAWTKVDITSFSSGYSVMPCTDMTSAPVRT